MASKRFALSTAKIIALTTFAKPKLWRKTGIRNVLWRKI